jgi:hypothetical protein
LKRLIRLRRTRTEGEKSIVRKVEKVEKNRNRGGEE